MANETTGNPKIYILSRANYDDIPDDPDLEYGNNIFFVRENSSETANLMSLYVGMAHQTDFYKIDYDDMSLSLSSEPDPETGEKEVIYTIANQDPYKVSGKLFYYEQVDKPDPENPSQRIPLDVGEQHKIVFFMWIEDGDYFVQCAQSGASSGGGGGGGGEVTVDSMTILKTAQDVIYGAGADLSGKTFSGTTAQPGATVLNNYPTSENITNNVANISLAKNSIAYGENNIIKRWALNSIAGGLNNIIDCKSSMSGGVLDNTGVGVVFGSNNELHSGESIILGCSNKSLYINSGRGRSRNVSIIGNNNDINPLNNVPDAAGTYRDKNISIIGHNNYIGVGTSQSNEWAGARNVYIVGHDCDLLKECTYVGNYIRDTYVLGCNVSCTATSSGVTVIGTNLDVSGITAKYQIPDGDLGLYVSESTSILLGYYNDPVINEEAYDFVIANGDPSSSTPNYNKANALILNGHSITLDPSKRSANSNIYATTGASLHPNYYDRTFASGDDRDETMTCLPENCSINKYASGTVKSISVSLVSEVSTSVLSYKISTGAPYIGKEVTGSTANYRAVGSDFGKDYCSTIVFRRSTQAITASSLMTNFTAVDGSKIYLMNPDIEITSFDIINIFLFYDGFHLCAIVSGYEE